METQTLISDSLTVLAKFKTIKLKKNSKEPAPFIPWLNPDNHHIGPLKKINYGIITGPINNLIVLDIDIKNDGLVEFNKYISEFGDPETFKVRSPSGGLHYYFKFTGYNDNDQYIINNSLTNRSGYRGKGIDIRTKGGYIVGPGSQIHQNDYKIINTSNIDLMPTSLINWLLFEDIKKQDLEYIPDCEPLQNNKNRIFSKNQSLYKYIVNDSYLISLLNKLDDKYLNNFSDWVQILIIFKNLDRFEIFDNWSKKSTKYDYNKNLSIYNNTIGVLDLGYLQQITGDKTEIIKYKEYDLKLETTNKQDIKNINSKYVFDTSQDNNNIFSYDDFINNSNIIIKSGTGTGKTSTIAKHYKRLKETDPDLKIITLTNMIALSAQHVQSFKDVGIDLKNYQDLNKIKNPEALTICLNSLTKLNIDDDILQDYIIYIDEVSAFINFTHNELLDSKLKLIYNKLLYILTHCKKVIVSDAYIKESIYELFVNRPYDILYINNHCKKFENVKAIRLRNEEKFLNKLKTRISSNKYFLFGCDSARTITYYYNILVGCFPDRKDDIILITREETEKGAFKLVDASKQFLNKFVLYSPSITTAVDFSIDTPQDVFIYITGKSIDAPNIFQQTTRTRNIKKVYYFCETSIKDAKYENIDALKTHLKQLSIYTNNNINDLCNIIEDEGEPKINENKFFKIYMINEYIDDIFQTNKKYYFEQFLINAGFKIIDDEKDYIPLVVDINLNDEINEKLFLEYIEADDKDEQKFKLINDRIKYLNLGDNIITIEKYKQYLLNPHLIRQHDALIRMLRSELYIENKIKDISQKTFNIKLMNNTYYKIHLIYKLVNHYNLNIFELDKYKDNYKDEIQLVDYYQTIVKIFNIRKTKEIKTKYDIIKLIVSLIKTMTGDDFHIPTRGTKKNDKTMTYNLNDGLIKNNLDLHFYKNIDKLHFNEDVYRLYNFEPNKQIFDNSQNDISQNDISQELDKDIFQDD